jgi:hypothetical protein
MPYDAVTRSTKADINSVRELFDWAFPYSQNIPLCNVSQGPMVLKKSSVAARPVPAGDRKYLARDLSHRV